MAHLLGALKHMFIKVFKITVLDRFVYVRLGKSPVMFPYDSHWTVNRETD